MDSDTRRLIAFSVIGACVLILSVGGIVLAVRSIGSAVSELTAQSKPAAAEEPQTMLKMEPLALSAIEQDETLAAEEAAADDHAPLDSADEAEDTPASAVDLVEPQPPIPSIATASLSAVNLPDFSGETVDRLVELGDLPALPGDACEVKVLNCAMDAKDAIRFEAAPLADASADRVWQIGAVRVKPKGLDAESAASDETTPVARLTMQDGKLLFQWSPEARNTAYGRLQNCVLSIHVADREQQVQLRRTRDVGPMVLDLGEDLLRIPLDGDCLPDEKLLTLQVVKLVNFPQNTFTKPGTSVSGLRKEMRIIVKNNAPGVEVRAQITGSEQKRVVQIAPVAVEASKRTTPFTAERFQTMMRILPGELTEAGATLNSLLVQAANLRNLSQQVSVMAVKAEAERVVRLKAVHQEMENVGKRIKTLQRRIPALQERLVAIQPLIQLGNQLHKKAEIHFRVFYVVEGKEVELLKAY